jgi:hypothetical protein
MNEWFNANLLSSDSDKTYFMKFQTKNNFLNEMNVTNNNNKMLSNTSNLKFLGIIIYNTSWKNHIDMIAPKLRQACCIARVIKPFFTKRYPKDYLLRILPRHYDLWANILGKFLK